MAPMTVQKRYLVANVIAMSWDLSPSSAMKMTAKLRRKALTGREILRFGHAGPLDSSHSRLLVFNSRV